MVNDFAGSRRLLAHTVITPKQPGWMEEVDRAISSLQAGFVEVLHDRRSACAVQIPVASGRREGDVSVL